MLQAVTYAADVAVLAGYSYSAHTGRYRAYNAVNVTTGPVLVALAGTAGVWPLAVLPASFTVLSAWALFRSTSSKQ